MNLSKEDWKKICITTALIGYMCFSNYWLAKYIGFSNYWLAKYIDNKFAEVEK